MATFLFSYLVISLCILYASANNNPTFLSIDCGSSDSYEDENSIAWTGDDNYVKTGESHSVQIPKYTPRAMNTIRVFTSTLRKNCYHIDSVRQGERVLVRASFLYGNYDNKFSPPSFQLFIEGNLWATVDNPIWGIVYHEVIYVTQRDSISVCVARSYAYPDQFPFISALEVRGLALSMYQYQHGNNGDNYPLFLRRRVAFGSNQTIRYPSDPYDRIWSNSDMNYVSLIPVSSNANLSNLAQVGEDLPPAVLKHAVTAVLPNSSIEISVGVYSPAYYIAYFSEVTQLKPNEKRSFRIFNDNGTSLEPIVPPFGDYITKYHNITYSKLSNLYIVPTRDSTLPPLINALEIFSVGLDALNYTNTNDVQGLASLQKAFPVLQEWSGDPCLPVAYGWEWVICHHEYPPVSPRVDIINLPSYGLSGVIPDFSSMDALQMIVLRNNSLKGPIPDFFARLPKLVLLDLRDNQLNGTVPASLLTKMGGNIAVSGNPDLCVPGISCLTASCSRETNTNAMTVLFGSIIPSIIIYTWF